MGWEKDELCGDMRQAIGAVGGRRFGVGPSGFKFA